MPRTKKKKPNPNANPTGLLQRMKPKEPKYTAQQIAAQERLTLELYAADERNAEALGAALIQMKKMLKGQGKGAFQAWWKLHKLNQNRVSYCTRLANGKHAAAKSARAANPQRKAVSEVRQMFGKFIEYASNERAMKTHDELKTTMRRLTHLVVKGVARMRNWEMVAESNPKVQAASKELERALDKFVDAAFVEVTFADLEKVTNRDMPRASDYGFGKQAKAKAAGAGV